MLKTYTSSYNATIGATDIRKFLFPTNKKTEDETKSKPAILQLPV